MSVEAATNGHKEVVPDVVNPEKYIGPLPNGRYLLRHVSSGGALEMRYGGALPGTPVTGSKLNRASHQQWVLEAGVFGYRIKNLSSKTFLSYDHSEPPYAGLYVTGEAIITEWQLNRGSLGWLVYLAPEDDSDAPPLTINISSEGTTSVLKKPDPRVKLVDLDWGVDQQWDLVILNDYER